MEYHLAMEKEMHNCMDKFQEHNSEPKKIDIGDY